eukprot:1159643-Pelagomonas_calceolata.AAC.4
MQHDGQLPPKDTCDLLILDRMNYYFDGALQQCFYCGCLPPQQHCFGAATAQLLAPSAALCCAASVQHLSSTASMSGHLVF